MWDLNDSPDQRRDDESEGFFDDKGEWVGSVSNSSSSAVVFDNGSEEEEEDVERIGGKKRISRIFGFSVARIDYGDSGMGPSPSPVTRQFFPVDVAEMVGGGGGPHNFPWAH